MIHVKKFFLKCFSSWCDSRRNIFWSRKKSLKSNECRWKSGNKQTFFSLDKCSKMRCHASQVKIEIILLPCSSSHTLHSANGALSMPCDCFTQQQASTICTLQCVWVTTRQQNDFNFYLGRVFLFRVIFKTAFKIFGKIYNLIIHRYSWLETLEIYKKKVYIFQEFVWINQYFFN